MSVKKLVSYSMFALGTARLAFSLAQHLAGHEVMLMEVFEALPFLSAGFVLYATDVHKILVSVSQTMYKSAELKSLNALNYGVASFFRRLSQLMYKYPELRGIDALNYGVASFFRRLSKAMYKYSELRGIDALNYFIANLTISFSQHFRKTHTGVLSYNMLAVFAGIILLIILLFLFGGYIP